MTKPIQKILFGSPGTGKSHQIKNTIAPKLKVDVSSENYIPTVFHPEYTYGDFMGKLMPLTDEVGKVEYKFYAGHFLKALAVAYKCLINSAIKYEKDKKEALEKYKKEIGISRQDEFLPDNTQELERRYTAIQRKTQNVLLVIDEINRGNSAAIFGTVFQLLDRKNNGWSDYPVILSDLEAISLLKEVGLTKTYMGKDKGYQHYYYSDPIKEKDYNDYLKHITSDLSEEDSFDLNNSYIKIPSNLSIIATMNTSDNSIYFMDSAFKRRWDWEFIEIEDSAQKVALASCKILLYEEDKGEWCEFVDKLNFFIRKNYKVIRKIEDKQVGYRFINEPTITEIEIKNKLMFFVWDSVFTNNKKPLVELLQVAENKLVTFGDFTAKTQVKNFVSKILSQ